MDLRKMLRLSQIIYLYLHLHDNINSGDSADSPQGMENPFCQHIDMLVYFSIWYIFSSCKEGTAPFILYRLSRKCYMREEKKLFKPEALPEHKTLMLCFQMLEANETLKYNCFTCFHLRGRKKSVKCYLWEERRYLGSLLTSTLSVLLPPDCVFHTLQCACNISSSFVDVRK